MGRKRKSRSVLRGSIALGTLTLLSFPAKTVFAQTGITTAQTTPANTAADGAITISGSITLTGNGNLNGGDGGAAVLLNNPVAANNSITNSGAITINASNASGILADTNLGASGSITSGGSITVTDGTLATSQTLLSSGEYSLTTGVGRYGIDISGSTPFVGTITQNSGDTITVRGNQSYGILVTPGLTGNISLSGFLGITGVDSFGLQTLGTVNGNINLLGTIHATGENTTAVSIGGPVTGQLDIDGTVRATGYYYAGTAVNARISQTAVTAKDIYGTVYNTAPSVAVDGPIYGYNELQGGSAVSVLSSIQGGILVDTAGVVVSYGSSPALAIGSTSIPTIGIVTSTGTGSPSVLIRGSVTGNGIFDGMSSTAIDIGSSQLTGGLKVASTGTVLGKAFKGNATGILYSTGAVAPTLVNLGTIKANVLFGYDGVTGGNATAVNDTVGALSAITNQGTILALTASGAATALNLSANTTGVTVTQLASGTATPSSITGDVLFGSGQAKLDLESGSLNGNVNFGSGTGDVLTINGGATMSGVLSSNGATPAVSIANGKLTLAAASAPTLSSLNIGSSGELIFSVNPSTGQNAGATVLGATVISSGGKIGLDVLTPLTSAETLTLITSSGSLSGSAITGQSATLTGDIPYFYVGNVTANQTTGAIMATLRDRTFAESGMVGTASAYNAIFAAANSDTQIRQTFDGAITRQAFSKVYQQMLPAYSGGLFEVLSNGAETVARAEADGALVPNVKDSGTWIQQIGFGAEDGGGSEQPGYRGGGLGFAFGWETPTSANSAIGISGSYLRASTSTSDAGPNNNQVGTVYSTGVYWRVIDSGLNINASLNVGYAGFKSERDFNGVDSTGTSFDRAANASWSGGLGNGHLGASYEIPLDEVYYFRPEASGDYFVLYEGSRTERGGSNAVDLAIASSTGKQGSGEGGLTFGAKLGDKDFYWRPEMTVGYRQVFGGAANTVAQFSGGQSFALSPAAQQGGALARIGVHGGNRFTDIAFEAGGEERGAYRSFDGRLVARFNF